MRPRPRKNFIVRQLLYSIGSLILFQACFFKICLADVVEGLKAYKSADYEKAMEEFKKESSDPNAQYYLGIMFTEGWVGKIDNKAAREWFEKSVTQGNPLGAVELATLLENGEGGEANQQRSKELYSLAGTKLNEITTLARVR